MSDYTPSIEVLKEYEHIANWLRRESVLLGPVGDTMHALAAEAFWRLLATAKERHRIPLYAMLDVWQALYGTSHPEFDEFYKEHGYAETWARLLAEVRRLRAQVEKLENQLDAVRALVGPDNESGMISASAIFHTIGTGNKGGES